MRSFLLVVVVAAIPVWIQFNCTNLRVCPRSPLGIRARSRGDNDQSLAAQRVGDGPLQSAVPSQGGTHDRIPRRNAEVIGQSGLGKNLIPSGNNGESRSPRLPVGRGRGRTGAPLAATKNVGDDNEIALGIQWLTRTNGFFPPTGG